MLSRNFRPKHYAELETQPLLFDSAFIKEFRKAMAVFPPFWAMATFLFINAGSMLNAEGIIANNVRGIPTGWCSRWLRCFALALVAEGNPTNEQIPITYTRNLEEYHDHTHASNPAGGFL